ncbi:hypothetical protein [Maritimibacter fusiformis]|uniref:Uncharacterized protein n=1 Tax=Maritimibacter fusiformis TaxID=2603819 RepID=A0A5D0RLI6_9RHOB|nr:hypothetical protein [Maritimibacter fusiformis]TYB81611.1 hypothetical protein FVF75_07805 [Maritimibacter fusiformis]
MRRIIALALTCALPATASATPYDGMFRPNYDFAASWDCTSLGMDGGAVAVQGDKLIGVENTCTLTDPVEVRDMNATLYDAECSGEGETARERLMLMAHDYGIYVIRDGFVSDWLRCE